MNEKRGVPSETIQQIRERVDIVDLISTYVSLSKAGQNFKGLCPFHSEKSPSFSVNPASQYFHCFGCQVGGDAFTFLMKQENMDFMEALRELSQRAGIALPEFRQATSRTESGLSRERYFHLYQLASSWYHRNLLEGPEAQEARAYLDQRGIARESWATFQLGYAPGGWNGLSHWMEGQAVPLHELNQAGLVVRKEKDGAQGFSTYDRFRNRVLFPIADTRGQILGFGGRVLQDDATPKYLNSPETDLFFKGRTLYGLDKARQAAAAVGRFYLVEGYFDVIALHEHGMKNVIAPLGTALTTDHVHILRRFVPSVTLVFDGDAAGVNAALRTLDLFVNSGMDVRVLVLPTGDDPDTFIRTNGVEAFRELDVRAATLLDFVVTSVLDKAKKDSIQDRVQRADEVLAILQKTKNPLEKDEYLKVVSERLGIRQDLLRKRLPTLSRRVDSTRPASKQPESSPTVSLPPGKLEERDLLILLVQGRLEPAHVLQLDAEVFTVPVYRHILTQALSFRDEVGQFDLEGFRGAMGDDPADEAVVAKLSVWDLYLEDIHDHVIGCLRILGHKTLQRRLAELIGQQKIAEREGRHEEVDALNLQMHEIRNQKAGIIVS
ncbi:MAG: DNA primase [Nitrospirota bacterium]|nr:DNA primase [Nitrospirota bacterium]